MTETKQGGIGEYTKAISTVLGGMLGFLVSRYGLPDTLQDPEFIAAITTLCSLFGNIVSPANNAPKAKPGQRIRCAPLATVAAVVFLLLAMSGCATMPTEAERCVGYQTALEVEEQIWTEGEATFGDRERKARLASLAFLRAAVAKTCRPAALAQ